jgi:glycosyltransferase involved in cell wall biosynthesis
MSSVSRISIIAPMLNEAEHVEDFVADVAEQDFDGEVEVIVADGGSTDGSAVLLRAAAAARDLDLTLVENPDGWVSHGLNACIALATGNLVVRLDCHSRYPRDYLGRLTRAAEETGALVVGGVAVGRGRTPTERAVACAMDSPFGGIGFYRVFVSEGGPLRRLAGAFGLRGAPSAAPRRMETDTITFGAFRPEAFALAGLFDEALRRNQDDEFNLRVRLAGGRVVLDPSVVVHYTPRGSLRAVFRQYFEYGFWKVAVMRKHRQAPGPRSLVPLAFVGSLALLAPAALRLPLARRALSAELAAYGSLAVASAAVAIHRRGESWRLLPRTVAVFPMFHVGYGAGMLAGSAALVLERADVRLGVTHSAVEVVRLRVLRTGRADRRAA